VVVSVCLGGECMTEVKSHPNLLRFYNSNGTRRILTLQLAAWPALDTCDRILKSIVQWRKRCSCAQKVTGKRDRPHATCSCRAEACRGSPHPSLSNPTRARSQRTCDRADDGAVDNMRKGILRYGSSVHVLFYVALISTPSSC
jgi:hypothetical protein